MKEITSFDLAFNYTLYNEGIEFTDNPLDAGGPTKFGITLKVYESIFGSANTDVIRNMSVDTAKQAYLRLFWIALSLGSLKDVAVAIAIFDTAVLYGPNTSGKIAQKALNLSGFDLEVDGILGDKSLECLNQADRQNFIENFRGLVLEHIESVIRSFPTNSVFKDGWTKRANRLLSLLIGY